MTSFFVSGPKMTWFQWGNRNLLALCVQAENYLTLVCGVKRCTVNHLPLTHCSNDEMTRLIDIALLNCWPELLIHSLRYPVVCMQRLTYRLCVDLLRSRLIVGVVTFVFSVHVV